MLFALSVEHQDYHINTFCIPAGSSGPRFCRTTHEISDKFCEVAVISYHIAISLSNLNGRNCYLWLDWLLIEKVKWIIIFVNMIIFLLHCNHKQLRKLLKCIWSYTLKIVCRQQDYAIYYNFGNFLFLYLYSEIRLSKSIKLAEQSKIIYIRDYPWGTFDMLFLWLFHASVMIDNGNGEDNFWEANSGYFHFTASGFFWHLCVREPKISRKAPSLGIDLRFCL